MTAGTSGSGAATLPTSSTSPMRWTCRASDSTTAMSALRACMASMRTIIFSPPVPKLMGTGQPAVGVELRVGRPANGRCCIARWTACCGRRRRAAPQREALVVLLQACAHVRRTRSRGAAGGARPARLRASSPGDRIGIWAPNCAGWVLTMFAAARAGLILVNINPAYREAGARVRAAPGRLPRLGVRTALQEQRLRGRCCRRCIPELAAAAPGRLAAAALPGAATAGATRWRADCRGTLSSTS